MDEVSLQHQLRPSAGPWVHPLGWNPGPAVPGSEQGPAHGGGRNLMLGDHSTRPETHSGVAGFILSTALGGI